MSSNSFMFNNMGRIGVDSTDQTQRNLYNTRFANYMLSDYASSNTSDKAIQFATAQPTLVMSGTALGSGISGSVVDTESFLTLKSEQERSLEKWDLIHRPFATIPYLGRGSCDTVLESQLLQGELVSDKKSVSTIMEKSFDKYSIYPVDDKMIERVQNPAYTIQETALNGWVRGGSNTRRAEK